MENETDIRLGIFIGLFLILATIETLVPRRLRAQTRRRRWFANWSLIVIDSLVLRAMAFVVPAVLPSNLAWILALPFLKR